MENRIIQLNEEDLIPYRYVFKILSKVFNYSYGMLREGVCKTPGRAMRFFLPHPRRDNYGLYYDMETNVIEESYLTCTCEMGEYVYDLIVTKYNVIFTENHIAYILREDECLHFVNNEVKISRKGKYNE